MDLGRRSGLYHLGGPSRQVVQPDPEVLTVLTDQQRLEIQDLPLILCRLGVPCLPGVLYLRLDPGGLYRLSGL